MVSKKVKIEKKNKIDFNKDLDNVSTKIKEESERDIKSLSQSPVKMEIEPNDTVLFNGKKATVISTWPNSDDIIILQDGMTIECTKKQVTIQGRVDTMDVPMKFKNGLPVSEKCYLRCNLVGGSSLFNSMNENMYVDFNEWKRKKGKQKVKVLFEDVIETFDAPKKDITLLELPDADEGQTDGYVPGALVNAEGEAERKLLIKANDYALSTSDEEGIPVLFITDDGYKDGMVRKSMLKTLSV